MLRSRRPRRPRRPGRTTGATPPSASPGKALAARRQSRGAPRPAEAETRLLRLAGAIAGLPVDAAIRTLAAAYAPDAPLPRAVAQGWLRSRDDKTAALALGWARENVRLALEETLARAPGRGALPGSAETRSWLVLAACEAIALEPREAAADRLRALLELSGHP
jgi:hypothetical protein